MNKGLDGCLFNREYEHQKELNYSDSQDFKQDADTVTNGHVGQGLGIKLILSVPRSETTLSEQDKSVGSSGIHLRGGKDLS